MFDDRHLVTLLYKHRTDLTGLSGALYLCSASLPGIVRMWAEFFRSMPSSCMVPGRSAGIRRMSLVFIMDGPRMGLA